MITLKKKVIEGFLANDGSSIDCRQWQELTYHGGPQQSQSLEHHLQL